jgi:hypothetical protein
MFHNGENQRHGAACLAQGKFMMNRMNFTNRARCLHNCDSRQLIRKQFQNVGHFTDNSRTEKSPGWSGSVRSGAFGVKNGANATTTNRHFQINRDVGISLA